MFHQKNTITGIFLHIISTLYGCLNMNNFKISEIRAALSHLQLQFKEAADIKNTELSHQRDKMEKIKTKVGKGRQVKEHHKMFAEIIKLKICFKHPNLVSAKYIKSVPS